MLTVSAASASPSRAAAQPRRTSPVTTSADYDPRWLFAGEVGGVIGGLWLKGDGTPTVHTGTGAMVALAAHRATSARIDAGFALRVGAQPLRLREHSDSWDGGTLTDTQLMGTVAVAIWQTGGVLSELNLGAGASAMSGARSIAPFANAPSIAPVAEAGVTIHRGPAGDRDAAPHPLALFARYSVVRVDPGVPGTLTTGNASAVAGWVSRVTVGIRVQR